MKIPSFLLHLVYLNVRHRFLHVKGLSRNSVNLTGGVSEMFTLVHEERGQPNVHVNISGNKISPPQAPTDEILTFFGHFLPKISSVSPAAGQF